MWRTLARCPPPTRYTPAPVKAIAKARPAPGADLIELAEPQLKPGHVKLRVQYGSVCGTDLHIFEWDEWAASRIHPPRVIGHEFAGIVEEVGNGVVHLKPGDFVATESHIVCGSCRQCKLGQGHVCVNTSILGVDVDGGFAPWAVIPEANARLTPSNIPADIACMQDPLGNAVHTALAGPVEGQDILITGLGPIGLFAAAVCKALGAKSIAATEVSEFRIGLGRQVGIDLIVNPTKEDANKILRCEYPMGVDGVLEMSGHPSSLDLAIEIVRPGGRISLLGVFHEQSVGVAMNKAIFKGADLQCIVGRRLWETWGQMGALLASGKLDVSPIVTHRFHYTEFTEAMELLQKGAAGKVVFSME